MNLDEQLLAQKEESEEATAARSAHDKAARDAWSARDTAAQAAWDDKAGRLREAQRNISDGAPEGSASSLREAVLAEKRKEAAEAGKEAASADSAPSAVSIGSAKLLQQSWLNLIPSFGCSLIWINIHAFFLNQLFGDKYFCKLGDEWAGAIPGAGGAAGKVAGVSGGGKKMPKVPFEFWGLIGCDLGCLLVIIGVACLIALLVGAISNPLEALKSSLGSLWGAITGTGNN